MASKVVVTKEKLNNIGDAIRNQLNVTTKYALDEMPEAIQSIQTGGGGGIGVAVTVTTKTKDFYGKQVTLTDGTNTMTTQFSNEGVAVFTNIEMEGELTLSVEYEGDVYSTTTTVKSRYNTELDMIPKVYGAYWDGTSGQVWSRTDDAVDLPRPVAALNNGTGSSPFDNIYPWSDIIKVKDPIAGTLVKVPKFYFKWTLNNGTLKIQVSKKQLEGYSCCPLCADREDGKGERDFAYVSRYLCANTTMQSLTNEQPKHAIKRETARQAIRGLGGGIYQWDYAALVTIWMLYLVEYAHWNSQQQIGTGGGYGATYENTGATDAMQYHTGTTASSRDAKGRIQYRWMEDLFSNCVTMIDGIRLYTGGAGYQYFIINNPDEFSDTEGGIRVLSGLSTPQTNNNWRNIKSMQLSEENTNKWFIFPKDADSSSFNTYIGDGFYLYTRYGGMYWYPKTNGGGNSTDVNGSNGLFSMYFENNDPNSISGSTARLMKLP